LHGLSRGFYVFSSLYTFQPLAEEGFQIKVDDYIAGAFGFDWAQVAYTHLQVQKFGAKT